MDKALHSDARGWGRQIVVGGAFALIIFASMVAFMTVFAPKSPPPLGLADETYDSAPMRTAVTPDRVSAHQLEVIAQGSRFLGQKGFYQTVDMLRQAYRTAGLEVLEFDNQTVAPYTLDRRILDATGAPLAKLDIYPFFPNFFQPMNTPVEGLTGKLLLVDEHVLQTHGRFDDCIALIDVENPPQTFGTQWSKYAQVGFKALIVAHRKDLTEINWRKMNVVGSLPMNYVRLAASPTIFDHLDQPVTLHVRTEFRLTSNPILVGILRAGDGPQTGREALIIPTEYDAPSILPDLATGELSAVPVATQLALIDGFKSFQKSIKRDVVFIATGGQITGHDSTARLMSILGSNLEPERTHKRLANGVTLNTEEAAHVKAILALAQDSKFMVDSTSTVAQLQSLTAPQQQVFTEQLRYVLSTLILERSEILLQAKLRFLKTGGSDLHSPEFAAYMTAKRSYDEAVAVAGYPLGKLLDVGKAFVKDSDLAGRFIRRFEQLREFHAQDMQRFEQSLAIHDSMRKYTNFVVVAPQILPTDSAKTKGEGLSIVMGNSVEEDGYKQYPLFNNMVLRRVSKARTLDVAAHKATHATQPFSPLEGFWYQSIFDSKQSSGIASRIPDLNPATTFWNRLSYPAVSLINVDRATSYELRSTPTPQPFMRDLSTLQNSLRITGDTVLWLAHGNGWFAPPKKAVAKTFGGRAFVASVGQSIVPDYPLVGALMVPKPVWATPPSFGYFPYMMDITDPYGRYLRPEWTGDVVWPYTPELMGFGPDGMVRYIKDEGPQGQSVFKSIGLSQWFSVPDPVNIVLFRAAPVAVLDLINPQTLQSYGGMELVTREGLAPLNRIDSFKADDAVITFIEPDRYVYVKLKAGAADGLAGEATRAFLLGRENTEYQLDPDKEIDGAGYLAGDTPLLRNIPDRAAAAMLAINHARLALQDRHGMVDARTKQFEKQAQQRLEESQNPDLSNHEQALLAGESVTYSTLNHPVLRNATWEAVIGILWYLGLLVPFAFFFEKLVFGFSDVSKQLFTQAIIILVVFGLLKLLHPAFEMIRSSLMILLGFFIFLISVGITILFAGKFQENLEELRKQRGKVAAAEVNTMGVIGTAFMLGLNNMHRRKVRTGLTCATLVLITFAMICFTSVSSNLEENSVAVGKAPFQGFLVKSEGYWAISKAELFALQNKYSHRYTVAPRTMFVGHRTWDQTVYNPQFDIDYDPATNTTPPAGTQPAVAAIPRKIAFNSILVLTEKEPLQTKIKVLTKRGWFSAPRVGTNDPIPVMLPEAMAGRLGIYVQDVDQAPLNVKISGKDCLVWGIFTADSLTEARDMDGRNLLPFDAEAIANPRVVGNDLLASRTDTQISADRVVLASDLPFEKIDSSHAFSRLTSVAVEFNALPYKAAKSVIDSQLEQSGRETYFGLDSVAYLGKIARTTSFAGLAELLVPLVVAALTVLNTMRGSVYERRDEIFVYNAVGIAPRYVFFMFFAEAFVYAVVGAVLGFVLSQGLGRILTQLELFTGYELTGGLKMTFTSINTIWASLAVAAAVFISTFFPARSAMKIATPSDDPGWKIPPSDTDTISFTLPFTFDRKDRVAVLEFFSRIFLDHGEGGAGIFHAGKPTLAALDDPAGLVPQIHTTIWLKPFDLGVSQELVIRLPADPETGEYIARLDLTRLSGTRESWLRLNKVFVALVRQHFLYWRAVSPVERNRMFDEARKQIEDTNAASSILPAPHSLEVA